MAGNNGSSTLPPKRQKLRNNEYYDIQETYDNLHARSKDGAIFKNLIPLIIDNRNIRLAYRNIKRNKGSMTAGSDRLTLERWENANDEEYINYVRHRIANYQPQTVRRVEIPKSNGKMRPLGIPTIGDRLVQQCIKQVLEPICEAKFFKHSYGFRPNRSTKHAIATIYHRINHTQMLHVVDVDIKGFFDNVNHSKLLKQLWTLGIRDKNLLCIISKMLKAEIKGVGIPTKGVPQGGILSPLLSNVVLNEFDWWVSNQWETFKTRHEYSVSNGGQGKKYRALRTGKLKEQYLVRYADDFKIMCKSHKDAQRVYIACVQWLQERLGLEVSDEKSKITDLRKSCTEFLGVEIGLQPSKKTSRKNVKFVVKSHMSKKAKSQCKETLKGHIKRLKENTTAENVMRYNSAILGIQNYYKVATHINLDANEIAYWLNIVLHNRLAKVRSSRGTPSETYKRLYPNNYKKWYIAKIGLFPLGDVTHERATLFAQDINNYTTEGRNLIHKNLGKSYDLSILHYLMNNPQPNGSVELNDNRISLYVGQRGKCGITGMSLTLGNMELHHKTPRHMGGDDKYKNLIFITKDVHKLVHATLTETIDKYLTRVVLDDKGMKKLNKLRILAGNFEI